MNTSRKGISNKIKPDYGMPDYYNFYISKYKSKFGDLSNREYHNIVSDMNKELADIIVEEGIDFIIPHQLGTIGVRKSKPTIKLSESGHLINRLPINPIETGKLWKANPEAKDKKIYIRYTNKHSDGYLFSIYYFRNKAKFKNKSVYTISYKRDLKRKLAKNIKEKIIDAFLINTV